MTVHKILLPTLLVFATLSGCTNDDSTTDNTVTATNSISVTSVTPSTAQAGVPTDFVVKVAYTLATDSDGVLDIGFNTSGVDSYNMVNGVSQVVVKGSGEHTFTVTDIPPVDWSPDKFAVLTTLAEYPKPSSWTPYATAEQVIEVTSASAKALPTTPAVTSSTLCYKAVGVEDFCTSFE